MHPSRYLRAFSLTVMLGLGWLGLARAEPLPAELVLAINEQVSLKLALIPAGMFIMGSSRTEHDAWTRGLESPPREVTISQPFYLAILPLTVTQMDALTGKKSAFFENNKDKPASRLSWRAAYDLCQLMAAKVGRPVRLPTEAEWEYACRAGSTTAYSFGDDPAAIKDYGWTRESILDAKGAMITPGLRLRDAGKLKPNAWGLYDLHGNVHTWCADWYAPYPAGPATDPRGPATGARRVARGGSYWVPAETSTSTTRWTFQVDNFRATCGLRVLVPTDPKAEPATWIVRDAEPVEVAPPPTAVANELVLTLAEGVTLRCAPIAPGKFQRRDGSATGTLQEVTLSKGYFMGRHEVTQQQWEAIMGDKPVAKGNAENLGDLKPVTMITWPQAVAFCAKLSAKIGRTVRLPTEAEWEYAARAGSTTDTSFGDDPNDAAEYSWGPGNAGGHKTHPVGLLKPNAWGLYDTLGNVWEMTADWFSPWTTDAATDPRGPDQPLPPRKNFHVTRGGSFYAGGGNFYTRYGYPDVTAKRHIGFRVLVTEP